MIGHVLSFNYYLSLCHLVHSADNIEKGTLAAAALAEHYNKFSRVNVKIDALQDLSYLFTAQEFLDDAAHADQRFAVLERPECEALVLYVKRQNGAALLTHGLFFFCVRCFLAREKQTSCCVFWCAYRYAENSLAIQRRTVNACHLHVLNFLCPVGFALARFYNTAYKTFVQETSGRDARLCQTIRGADYTRADKDGKFTERTAPDMRLSLTGYQYTKYVIDDENYNNGRTNDNDVPLLRYAEVLLNYAEAKAELGTINAEDWSRTIGALRRRAGITGGDLDKLPTVVDTYLQQTFYPNVSDPVILEVRRDRAIELILEGFRLNDLKRWACGKNWETAPWDGVYIPALDAPVDLNGDGEYDVYVTEDANYQKDGKYKSIAMTLNDQQKAVKIADDPAGGYLLGYQMPRKWNDNMYLYPVPENVILKNDNLKQNPGWK